jgi:hypothetical protein
MVVQIEIDGVLIDWLVAMRWLEPRETYRREQIANAIRRMLVDAAQSVRA